MAVNGQDPEFIGLVEPTFSDYIRETAREKTDQVEFCAYNANEVDLFYVLVDQSEAKELELKITRLLNKAWLQLNENSNNTNSPIARIGRNIKSTPEEYMNSRIVSQIKLNNG